MNGQHNLGALYAAAAALLTLVQLPLAMLMVYLAHPDAIPMPTWGDVRNSAIQLLVWWLGYAIAKGQLPNFDTSTQQPKAAT